MPLKIESIAHDKLIWNLKSDVIRFDRSGLSSSVQILTEAASLLFSNSTRLAKVRPVSMMSSTIKTFLPLTETSRSLMILTSPEETVLFP